MKFKLSDVMDLIGGGTPKTSKPEYWNGTIPWLSVKDFNNGFRYVYETEKTITELGLENSSTKLLQKGDVIISARGTVGEIATIPFPMAFNQSCYGLRAISGIVTSDYLYYLIKHNVSVLKKNTHGSVFDTITRNTFDNIEVEIPSIITQEKIASILSDYDEKIELNNTINNNLEQQAQALYENIFCIHSDIDTKHISLSDLMDYAGGSQPPASEFVFSERDGYIRFVQIRDYDTDSHITYIPDSPKNKLCEEHNIMIARYGASLGRICFGINGAYNVALAKVFPKKSFFREFLRCYLSSRTFYEGINNKGGRSAQAGFNQSDINSFEIDFPVDETIVKKFECTVAPMFEQRLQLKKENQHLASLRDTLLPKLMSGELDVSNVEI